MRQEMINIYKFSELSEKAQRRAWETGPDFSGDSDSDYRATLAAFEKIFDISVYRWDVNYYNYDFAYVTAGAATDAPDGDPLRLARYIWNNYAEYITKGKYYSTPGRWINGKYEYKFRYSRATFEMDNCPLTGFCADMDILQPVIDCLHYKRFFDSFRNLIDACLTAFFRSWQANAEYHASFEYFAEMCEINEYEFTETGEMWT
jgi:hypothetical protein